MFRGGSTPGRLFWYATIFDAGGLCLNPTRTLVRNLGLDGSGEHSPVGEEQDVDPLQGFAGGLPDRIQIDAAAVERIKAYLALPRPSPDRAAAQAPGSGGTAACDEAGLARRRS